MGNSYGFAPIAVLRWYLSGTKNYGIKGWEMASAKFNPNDIPNSLSGTVVAITGANSGLGFACAKIYAERDAEVHLLCRNVEKGEKAKSRICEILEKEGKDGKRKEKNIFAWECNASDMSSIRLFSEKFNTAGRKLDVLVNNAGGMPAERTWTNDEHDTIMASALGGTMLLTACCLPSLKNSNNGIGRVINVVSGGAYCVKCPPPNDLDFRKASKYDATLFYAYAKRAQVILTELWPKFISEIDDDKSINDKIRFFCMHPGWAETEGVADALEGGRLGLSSTEGFRTAEQGADTILFLGATKREDILEPSKNGELYFDREVVSKHLGLGTNSDESTKNQLWDAAAKYVGGLSAIVA